MEAEAERVYGLVLNILERLLGSDVTNTDELDAAGAHLLGAKYMGTFASDTAPRLTAARPYAIANLDDSAKAGSHWTALAYDPETGRTHYYDSFGRSNASTLRYGGAVADNDTDAEQLETESDCGARSMAYLMVAELFGLPLASLI